MSDRENLTPIETPSVSERVPTVSELIEQSHLSNTILTLYWLFSDQPTVAGFDMPFSNDSYYMIDAVVAKICSILPRGTATPQYPNFFYQEVTQELLQQLDPHFLQTISTELKNIIQLQQELKPELIHHSRYLSAVQSLLRSLPDYLKSSNPTEVPLTENEARAQAEGEMANKYSPRWRTYTNAEDLERELAKRISDLIEFSSSTQLKPQKPNPEAIRSEVIQNVGPVLAQGYKLGMLASYDQGYGVFLRKPDGQFYKLSKAEFATLELEVKRGDFDGPRDQVLFKNNQGQPIDIWYSTDSLPEHSTHQPTLINHGYFFSNPVSYGYRALAQNQVVNQDSQLLPTVTWDMEGQVTTDLRILFNNVASSKQLSTLQEILTYNQDLSKIPLLGSLFLDDLEPETIIDYLSTTNRVRDVMFWQFLRKGIPYFANREMKARLTNRPSNENLKRGFVFPDDTISPDFNNENHENSDTQPHYSLAIRLKNKIGQAFRPTESAASPPTASATLGLENQASALTNVDQNEIEERQRRVLYAIEGENSFLSQLNLLSHKNDELKQWSPAKLEPTSVTKPWRITSTQLAFDPTSPILSLPVPQNTSLTSVSAELSYHQAGQDFPSQLRPNQFVVETASNNFYRLRVTDRSLTQAGKISVTFEGHSPQPRYEVDTSALLVNQRGLKDLQNTLKKVGLSDLAQVIDTSAGQPVMVSQLIHTLKSRFIYSYSNQVIDRRPTILEEFKAFFDPKTGKYGVQCNAANLFLAECLKIVFKHQRGIHISTESCFQVEPSQSLIGDPKAPGQLYLSLDSFHRVVRVKIGHQTALFDATPPEATSETLANSADQAKRIVHFQFRLPDDTKTTETTVITNSPALETPDEDNHNETKNKVLKQKLLAIFKNFDNFGLAEDLGKSDPTEPIKNLYQLINTYSSLNHTEAISHLPAATQKLKQLEHTLEILLWLSLKKKTYQPFNDGTYPDQDLLTACTHLARRKSYYRHPVLLRQLLTFTSLVSMEL